MAAILSDEKVLISFPERSSKEDFHTFVLARFREQGRDFLAMRFGQHCIGPKLHSEFAQLNIFFTTARG